jgi:hypothetical protein
VKLKLAVWAWVVLTTVLASGEAFGDQKYPTMSATTCVEPVVPATMSMS